MLSFSPRYAFCFINHGSKEYSVPACEFASTSVSQVKTQPVRPRKMPAGRRIVNLCKVFYLKSPAQNNGSEGTRQVNQKETALVAVEYMRKVQVSVAVSRLVKFPDKARQLSNETSSEPQIFTCGRLAEAGGQSAFQCFGVRDLLGDDEAPFLEQ